MFFCCRFHQVDSDDFTIAINFWWRSNMMSCMLEHMDAYYLRRILRRYWWWCSSLFKICHWINAYLIYWLLNVIIVLSNIIHLLIGWMHVKIDWQRNGMCLLKLYAIYWRNSNKVYTLHSLFFFIYWALGIGECVKLKIDTLVLLFC